MFFLLIYCAYWFAYHVIHFDDIETNTGCNNKSTKSEETSIETFLLRIRIATTSHSLSWFFAHASPLKNFVKIS